jgi:uncharacterized protein YjbI with pentapeptide repeats
MDGVHGLVAWDLPLRVLLVQEQTSPWWKDFPWALVAAILSVAGVLIGAFISKRLSEQQFERKSLAEEFTDILNRFASENPIIRANAAIRLGEIAYRKVRRTDWLSWMPFDRRVRTPTTVPAAVETDETEPPFFGRTIAQLAAALHMEEHAAVRAEIGRALERIADKAGDEKSASLTLLIEELAGANKRALGSMCDILGQAIASPAKDVARPALEALSAVARFCKPTYIREDRDGAQRHCLEQLTRTSEYDHAAAVYSSIRHPQGHKVQLEMEEQLLMDIKSRAERLRDTQRALANAASHLHQPTNLPTSWPLIERSEKPWQRQPPMVLDHSFLAGAESLAERHFEGISMEFSMAQGSDFHTTKMQGARLTAVGFDYANLKGADLRGAVLSRASCNGANLSSADMQNVSMYEAKLKRAYLGLTKLNGSSLRFADFSGADLSSADFRGADITGAKFRGANLKRTKLYKALWSARDRVDEFLRREPKTDFTDSNWWEAEFWELNMETRRFAIDLELPAWLRANFPASSEDLEFLDRWLSDPGKALGEEVMEDARKLRQEGKI